MNLLLLTKLFYTKTQRCVAFSSQVNSYLPLISHSSSHIQSTFYAFLIPFLLFNVKKVLLFILLIMIHYRCMREALEEY